MSSHYRLPELWKAKAIERIDPGTKDQRQQWIEMADNNFSNLRSDQVYIDLTDSASMRGDETHGSISFIRLKEAVQEMFGFCYIIPVRQSRAAEHALAQALLNRHSFVPGNDHSDTTRAYIKSQKAIAIDCAIEGAFETEYQHPFKGNMNLPKLKDILHTNGNNVPMISVTVTGSKGGGQPISIQNLNQLRQLCRQSNVPVIIDSACFAENAWFIQQREAGYSNWDIPDIIREMYRNADGMILNGSKDGLVNNGGLFATNNKDLFNKVQGYIAYCESYTTQGRLTETDMEAFRIGLNEVTQQSYLNNRIYQVFQLGKILIDANIPVQKPIGGHAIVIDASAFLPRVPKEEHAAKTLAVELYVEAGIRGVEIDTILDERDTSANCNRPVAAELLRLAIPKQTYTNNQLAFVANALVEIFNRRFTITRGFNVVHEDAVSKQFTIQMKRA